jgi:hypothetical protein
MTFTDAPDRCGICKNKLTHTLYDVKTVLGPWEVLCGVCYELFGVPIGQRYHRDAGTTSFVKVEG